MKNALQLIKELCDSFFVERDIEKALGTMTDDIRWLDNNIHGKDEACAFIEAELQRNPVPYSCVDVTDEALCGENTAYALLTAKRDGTSLSYRITASTAEVNGENKLCILHTSIDDAYKSSLNEVIEHVASGFAIYTITSDKKYIPRYVNDSYYKICEKNRSGTSETKADMLRSVHREDKKELEKKLSELANGLDSFETTYRYISGSGKIKWIDLNAKAVKCADGTVNAYFTYTDLTEQIKLQKQLTDVIHTVPCGICLYRWDGSDLHPLIVNNRFSEMLGEYALDYLNSVENLNFTHVHPDDLQGLKQAAYLALTLTHKVDYTYRSLNLKSQEYLWIRMRGTMIPQPDGTHLVYISYYDVTQEHIAEQKLHESEKLLEFAADHAGLWYWRYDVKNDRAYLDTKNQREYGLPKVVDHFLETWVNSDFVPTEYADVYRDAYSRIKEGEPQVVFEVALYMRDGKLHWTRCCLTNVFDNDGNVAIAVCTSMLIDNEKEIWAKYELEKKKTFLTDESLLAHAIINLTTKTVIEYVYQDGTEIPENQRDAFTFGKENAGRLLIDDDERKQYLAINDDHYLLERFAAGETEFRMDYRRRLRTGEISWVRSTIHVVRDPRNTDILLFEYWYDIEEEKMLELMYFSLANDNYDFVARVNVTNHNYVIFPKKGLRQSVPPLRGNDINIPLISLAENYVIPEDRNITIYNTSVEGMKHNLSEQERYQFICREKQPNGTIRHKKITEYYLDRQREIIVVTREDITDIIKAETEKNEMLVTALEAANQASQAKSQFLSRVSHELRTPLNAIIGFIELAKDAGTEHIMTYLSNSNVAAKQLLNIINDVLDMSSIESGKMKIANTPFDFKHMIHSLTNIYLSQCQEKGLTFETRIMTPINEWLMGDQLRVNQILLNLLNNAVKFTAKGHVWLQISRLESKENHVFVRFEVIDTGCGMTNEMQARLFKPFEQESAVTAQKYGGNGLGLSIVNSLVHMMDGVVRVDSIHGKGTTFTVDIPFGKSEIEKNIRLPEGIDEMRILAVDDEAAERQYLAIVLNRIGVNFTCVADGDSALQALERADKENKPYNLCLVDWKLPNMDGMEVTKRIRERYGNDMIVIVVSAYEHYQADVCAKEAGVNMFIAKPLFQSTLLDLFMTITGGNITKTEERHFVGDFKNKRVLLTEDNAMNRMVAEGLINKLGVECECAEDGSIAVEMFRRSVPDYYDAILMDIQMPTMDGFEATEAIRALDHPNAKTIQIIALTANAFNEDIARTLSSGMNAHVTKPIEPDMLADALDKAFSANAAE